MDNYKIYKYTSPSGKVYIGQTCRTLSQRAGGRTGVGYLRKNKNGEYEQYKFAHAILKYGFENFKVEILEDNLSKEEADLKEIEYIKLYKSTEYDYGYNIANGGSMQSLEDRERMSEIRKEDWRNPDKGYIGMKNGMLGKHHSDETIKELSDLAKQRYEKMSEKERLKLCKNSMKNGHMINQYDLDGVLLKQYGSMRELETLGFKKSSVYNVCSRRKTPNGYINSTYKGYQWRYSDDCDDIGVYHKKNGFAESRLKPIALIDDNGNIIKTYPKISEAAKELNLNPSSITQVCKGNYSNTKGYIFKYI